MLLQCRGTDWLRGQMSSQQCGLRNEDKVLAHSLLLWSLLPNASLNIASDRGMQYHLSLPPHVCVFNNLEGVSAPSSLSTLGVWYKFQGSVAMLNGV